MGCFHYGPRRRDCRYELALKIGTVDTERSVLVIAELGNNHEGDIGRAVEMVSAAADAGADAVKVQTFRTESFVRASETERFARLKGFELGLDATSRLAELARKRGLLFIATPFDVVSAAALEPLVDAYKIASGDADFFPLLRFVAGTGKPMVMSTGGGDMNRVDRAVSAISSVWKSKGQGSELALLHCVSAYPTPENQANLLAIQTLAATYTYPIGYSDHTLGIFASIAAVALGAHLIEKHLTLSKSLSGFRDHQLSSEPAEFRKLVEGIRSVSRMLGDGRKTVQPSEHDHIVAAGRSIVAARDLPAGHVISLDDVTWMRPSGGIPPGEEAQVIGRSLTRALATGELILPDGLG